VDRQEHGRATAELKLVEGHRAELDVGTDAEVEGIITAEEGIASQAEMKLGVIPHLAPRPNGGSTQGQPRVGLGFGGNIGHA
jgi:hypothetical protein